jgi:nucleoside-diphosphate-sugar epimerase
MLVVITGAAGVLGSNVAPLVARNHRVRLVDMLPVETDFEFVQADLSDYDQALAAVSGADIVVHCAAIHPWKPYTDDQYLDCNIKAVHFILKACADAGVKRVIYTSSIAANGYKFEPELLPLTEDAPERPVDLYSITKLCGEKFCEQLTRMRGVPTLCIRPPAFFPVDDLRFGLGLLGGWLHWTDVASAHAAAVDFEFTGHSAYFATADLPYTAQDAVALRDRPAEVIERYFPGAVEFFAERGIEIAPIRMWHSIEKAKRDLGWKPAITFEVWKADRLAREARGEV